MKTIIYFAGYKGHNSNKFKLLKNYFYELNVIQFNQTFDFIKVKIVINEMIMKYSYDGQVVLIGSSLGCIPAIHSGLSWDKNVILINPSYFPEETLKDCLTETELMNLNLFKSEIERVCKSTEFICNCKIDLFVAEDDERISKENRERFIDIISTYINYIDISKIGKHEYSILKDKLLKIRTFIYEKEIDIEDFFQLN